LISECFQRIENGDESSDIKKRERSIGPKLQLPIEEEVMETERIERRTDDLRRDARGVRKL
jgi:hypothetical protein